MDQLVKNPGRSVLYLLAYLGFISWITLGSWGVIETSEARYAEIAREMLASGDWLHPTLLGIQHYHKPPVTYWITALGYQLFGVHAFGARFFLVISYLCQVALVYFISRRLWSDYKIAFAAAIIYSSFPIVLASARGLTTDSYLTTFELAAIASWLQWRFTHRFIWLYGIALMLGLGFLTKGPVVLIVPVLVMVGLASFGSSARKAFTFHHLASLLLFLIIAFSWFVVLIAEHREMLDYFLFRHTLDRLTHAEVFKRSEPWWYYLAFAPLLALPWTTVFLFKIRPAATTEFRMVKKIVIFWVALPLLFFSLSSSKLVLYVLPLYSGLALAAGFWINNFSKAQKNTLEKIVFLFTGLLATCLLVFFNLTEYVQLNWFMRFLPALFVLGIVLFRKETSLAATMRSLFYSLFLTGFLLTAASFLIRENDLRFNSTKSLADWIKSQHMNHLPVLVYNALLPSVSFHLQKPVVSLYDGNPHLNREIQFERNDAWKKTLFHLQDTVDRKRLLPILEHQCVLIVKGKIQQSSNWLYKYFNHEKKWNGWTIYY